MLSDCRSLTHLQLDVCPDAFEQNPEQFNVNRFFTTCHWPSLRHLTIKGFGSRENADPTIYNSHQLTFLNRHINLESLYITNNLAFPVIPPQLRAVACYPWHSGWETTTCQSTSLPVNAAQNLTHLFLFSYGSLFDVKKMGGLPSLKACILPAIYVDTQSVQLSWLAEFVTIAPNVDKIAIRVAGFHHKTVTSKFTFPIKFSHF